MAAGALEFCCCAFVFATGVFWFELVAAGVPLVKTGTKIKYTIKPMTITPPAINNDIFIPLLILLRPLAG